MRAASAPRSSPARSPVSRFERPCFPRSALLVVVRASLLVRRRALGLLATVTCRFSAFSAPDGIRTRNLRSLKPLLLGRCSTRGSERGPPKRQEPPRRSSPPARRLTPAKAIRVYLFGR